VEGTTDSRGSITLQAMCYVVTHMSDKVGVRELRQHLSRYLDRVKDGEALVVTERGREVARLIPAGAEPYAELAERFGSSVPVERLESIAAKLAPRSSPAGSTDARLAEGRSDRGR
jgi:prevent-host-death family protein